MWIFENTRPYKWKTQRLVPALHTAKKEARQVLKAVAVGMGLREGRSCVGNWTSSQPRGGWTPGAQKASPIQK